jgi:50S ribosomal protein L16 3-hydroxylase
MTSIAPLSPFSQDLASWLEPHSVSHFRARHWRRQALFVPGDVERLRVLHRALGSFDLQHLLGRAREPMVRAWYVDEGKPDFSLQVPVDAAYRLYRAGMTLYFDLRDDLFDTSLLRAFTASLGHPNENVLLSVFATRKGKRTPPHVDQNENFTIQLTGHKRWGYCLDPHHRVSIEAWNPDAPETPPFERADLTPGSMLYVPKGWLHETEDLADSISLNICFPHVTWAQYLAPALTRALERDPRWSADASGLRGMGADAQASARREAAALVKSLPECVALDPVALQPHTVDVNEIGPGSRFRRNPHATAQAIRLVDGGTNLLVRTAWNETFLSASHEVLVLCAWITRQADFTVEAAAQACASPLDETVEVLAALAEAGFVVPCAP